MLTTADVLKINCKFIGSMSDYLQKRKYVADYEIPTNVFRDFANAAMASTFSECLTYEDECALSGILYKVESCTPSIESCNSQANIRLSATSHECTYNYTLVNPQDGSQFPLLILENNSIYHDSVIDVWLTNTCNSSAIIQRLLAGCVGDTCNDAQRYAVLGSVVIPDPRDTYGSDGYISAIPIAQVVDGVVSLDTYDISPANITTWTSCPDCTTIDPSDLEFGSTDYVEAWTTLMTNIALTLHDNEVIAPQITQIGGPNGSWIFQTFVKHNPVGPWMGFKKDGTGKTTWSIYNDLSESFESKSFDLYFLQQGQFMGDSTLFEIPCGDLSIRVDSFSGYTHQGKNTTTFNKIELVQPNGSTSLVGSVGSGSLDCNWTTLTATYTTTSPVESTAWIYDEEILLEDNNVITVFVPGVYTFKITHANGCVNTQTIEI